MSDYGVRKVYVDGEQYTNLKLESDGSMFTDVQHPYVNLAKLFEGAVKGDVNFHSSFGVEIEIKAL